MTAMSFMDTPRGQLLNFLRKQSEGAFTDITLEEHIALRVGRTDLDRARGLVGASTLTGADYLSALATLRTEAAVVGDAITDEGLDTHAVEYKQYLVDAEVVAPAHMKEGLQAEIVKFDAKQQALVDARALAVTPE